MAAHLLFPTKKQWQVLWDIGLFNTEGAILVSPAAAMRLKALGGEDIAGNLIDYDFGGDVLIDIVWDSDSSAWETLCEEAGVGEIEEIIVPRAEIHDYADPETLEAHDDRVVDIDYNYDDTYTVRITREG